jgi:hypothetical protein
MNMRTTGTWLRLTGPVLQLTALAILAGVKNKPKFIMGYPTDTILFDVFLVGMTMVVVGVLISRRPGKPKTRDLEL